MESDELEQLLSFERSRPRPGAPDLIARIVADAARMQPVTARPVRSAASRPWDPLRGLFGFLGGERALASLAGAALVGLWLGLAPPVAVASVTDTFWQADSVDTVELIPAYDEVLAESDP